jgi:tetratricopeptide (TPR) repeat protein
MKLAPEAVDAIGEWLVRPHATDVAARRKVLVDIKAAIPDKNGRFVMPWSRPKDKELAAEDNADWLKDLLAKSRPDEGEVIADVVAIRALSATKDVRAAPYIFDVAFAEATMIYRDECGRYIRKMEAYSIPMLTKESIASKNADRRRYATWQLERLDRQDPIKALAAAVGDDALQIAILEAFREVRHREAVHAVWMYVDASSANVRAQARKTWMDYITGPPPPPAPRQRLKLPGGKETKFPKPLWLTYRELADNELRKAANTLLHEDYGIDEAAIDDREKTVKAQPIDLVDVTNRLFAYFDGERKKRDAAQWDTAKKKFDKGDVAGAAQLLDQLIAATPDRAERVEMAKVYVAYGKQLEGTASWTEASAAYSKAHGLDPRKHTLAAHHFALGKALEARGKDGGPDYRRAIALDPELSPAARSAAADSMAEPARPVWMLYAAIGAGGLAVLLFGAAMLRRRT